MCDQSSASVVERKEQLQSNLVDNSMQKSLGRPEGEAGEGRSLGGSYKGRGKASSKFCECASAAGDPLICHLPPPNSGWVTCLERAATRQLPHLYCMCTSQFLDISAVALENKTAAVMPLRCHCIHMALVVSQAGQRL